MTFLQVEFRFCKQPANGQLSTPRNWKLFLANSHQLNRVCQIGIV